MKTLYRKVLITLLPLFGAVALDWASKRWALGLSDPVFFGPLKFKLVFNEGFMMGSFSELSSNAKDSLFFTLGIFICFTFLFCLWLVPIRSRLTIVGMSLLAGGILGNLNDRFHGRAVVDFLSFAFIERFPFINAADLFQFLGYGLISFGVYRDSLFYWPRNDWRIKYLVHHQFQFRASFLVATLTFFSSMTAIVFSYYFLKEGESGVTKKTFFLTGTLLSLFLSSLSFLAGLMLTHRVAGPIYAVQRSLSNMLRGKIEKLELRGRDEFRELERMVNLVQEEYAVLQKASEVIDDEGGKTSSKKINPDAA